VTDAMKAMGLPVGRHTLGRLVPVVVCRLFHMQLCAIGELEVDIFHGLEDGHYEGL
jgi:hypothetical protein